MSLVDVAKAIVLGLFFILLGGLSLFSRDEFSILWPWTGIMAMLMGSLAVFGAIYAMIKR